MKALVQHQPSGEIYVVEMEAVWSEDGDHCTGSEIVAVAGPVARRDLGIYGPLEPSRELFDAIDAYPVADTEDVGWLQHEEDHGRISYPVGAR